MLEALLDEIEFPGLHNNFKIARKQRDSRERLKENARSFAESAIPAIFPDSLEKVLEHVNRKRDMWFYPEKHHRWAREEYLESDKSYLRAIWRFPASSRIAVLAQSGYGALLPNEVEPGQEIVSAEMDLLMSLAPWRVVQLLMEFAQTGGKGRFDHKVHGWRRRVNRPTTNPIIREVLVKYLQAQKYPSDPSDAVRTFRMHESFFKNFFDPAEYEEWSRIMSAPEFNKEEVRWPWSDPSGQAGRR